MMSKHTELRVTIPPLGGDLDGTLEAIKNARTKSDTGLSPWAEIKRRIGFDDFQATVGLQPTHQGHHGPVQFQHPERFSEEYFKRSACFSIQQAIGAMTDLSDNQKDIVLNVIGPHFMKAGRALAEARMRDEHYDDVETRRRVRDMLKKKNAEQIEEQRKKADQIINVMNEYVRRGHTVSRAAELTFKHNPSPERSAEANRRLYYRRGGKKKL